MELPVIIFISVLGYAISIIILYSVISNASRSKDIRKIAEAQLALMAEMARKNGVEEGRIQSIVKFERPINNYTFNIPAEELLLKLKNIAQFLPSYKIDDNPSQDGVIKIWDTDKYYECTVSGITANMCLLNIRASKVGVEISKDQANQFADDFVSQMKTNLIAKK